MIEFGEQGAFFCKILVLMPVMSLSSLFLLQVLRLEEIATLGQRDRKALLGNTGRLVSLKWIKQTLQIEESVFGLGEETSGTREGSF